MNFMNNNNDLSKSVGKTTTSQGVSTMKKGVRLSAVPLSLGFILAPFSGQAKAQQKATFTNQKTNITMRKSRFLNALSTGALAGAMAVGGANNLLAEPTLNQINPDSGVSYEDSQVAIGTGEVLTDQAQKDRLIVVGSVDGAANPDNDITVKRGNTLWLTGNDQAGGGDLFVETDSGKILVEDGTLKLGNQESNSQLNALVELGYTGSDLSENSSGHLTVVGTMDLIDSVTTVAASKNNSVTVNADGHSNKLNVLITELDLGATELNNDVSIIAKDNAAQLTTVFGNVGGDINVIAGADADADATFALDLETYKGTYLTPTFNVAGAINLDGSAGSGQARLDVAGFLTVGDLSITDNGGVQVSLAESTGTAADIASVLTVTESYKEGEKTQVSVSGNGAVFDVSATDFGAADIDGIYYLQNGGVMHAGELTVDTADFANTKNSGAHFIFENEANASALFAETLNLTDSNVTGDTITLGVDNMILGAGTLNLPSGVTTVAVGDGGYTGLAFTGGTAEAAATINVNVYTAAAGGQVIVMGDNNNTETTTAGFNRDTTVLGAGKTLNITETDGLNVKAGGILVADTDGKDSYFKVADGGFVSGDDNGNGTGVLQVDGVSAFGAAIDTVNKTVTMNRDGGKVIDDFFGHLVVTGLSGDITKDSFLSLLDDGATPLVEGEYSSLTLRGVSIDGKNEEDPGRLVGYLSGLQPGNEAVHSQQYVIANTVPHATLTGQHGSDLQYYIGSIDGKGTGVNLILKGEAELYLTGNNPDQEGQIFINAVNGNTGKAADIIVENGVAIIGNNTSMVSLRDNVSPISGETSGIILGFEKTSTLPNVDDSTGGSLAVVGDFAANNIFTLKNQEGNNITITRGAILDAQDVTLVDTTMSVGGKTFNSGETNDSEGHLVAASVDIDESSRLQVGTYGASATASLRTVGGKGLFWGEPAWNGNIFDGSDIAVGEFSGGATSNQLISGQNTFFALGTTDVNRFVNDINMLEQANIGLDWNGTTTGMAFYAPVTLTSITEGANSYYGSILVDNDVVEGTGLLDNEPVTKDDAGGETKVLRPNVETAKFDANTITLVDAASMGRNGTVLTANSRTGNFVLDSTADLVVMGGVDGQSLKMIDGFTSLEDATGANLTTASKGWGLNATTVADGQLIFDSRLLADNSTITLESNNVVVVDLKAAAATAVYDQMQAGAGQVFDGVADAGLDIYSANDGVRYISTLDSRSQTLNAPTETISNIAESSMQLAALGGTNKIALEAGEKLSTAVGERVTILGGTSAADLYPAYSAGGASDNTWDIWLTPFYQWGSADSRSAGYFQSGYDLSLGGVAFGGDVQINSKLTVGLGVSLGTGDLDSSGDLTFTTNDADFQGVAAYAAWRENNWGLAAYVGYTAVDNDIRQRGAVLGFGDLTASPDSHTFTAGLRGEYVYHADNVDIMPHVGVRYTSVKTDGFNTMSASGQLYNTESDTQNVWTLPVGVTFSKAIETDGGWNMTPSLDLGFIVAAGDLEAASRASISGTNIASGEMLIENMDSFTFNGSLGLDAINAGGVAVSFDYNIQASGKETAHAIIGTVGWTF